MTGRMTNEEIEQLKTLIEKQKKNRSEHIFSLLELCEHYLQSTLANNDYGEINETGVKLKEWYAQQEAKFVAASFELRKKQQK